MANLLLHTNQLLSHQVLWLFVLGYQVWDYMWLADCTFVK